MYKRYRHDLFWAAASDIYFKVSDKGLKDVHLNSLLKEFVPPLSEDVKLESGPNSINGNDPVGEIKIRPNVNPFDPNQNIQYDEKEAYKDAGEVVFTEDVDRLETIRAKERQKLRAGLKDRKYARQAKQEKAKKSQLKEDHLAADVESNVKNIQEQDKPLEEFGL